MALTKVRVNQVNTDLAVISDPIVTLNYDVVGHNTNNLGFMLTRGIDPNVGLLWVESEKYFQLSYSIEDGARNNSVNLSSNNSTLLTGTHLVSTGQFTAAGDAMSGTYILRNISIGTPETELYLDGESGQIILNNFSAISFTATVTAIRTDNLHRFNPSAAGFTFSGVISRGVNASCTVFATTPSKSVLSSQYGWDCNVVNDTVNGALTFKVTGATDSTIRWVASVITAEVTV